MDIEKTADELAALAMIGAGITIIVVSIFATLFTSATVDVSMVEKLGGILITLPSGYLFGKSRPTEK